MDSFARHWKLSREHFLDAMTQELVKAGWPQEEARKQSAEDLEGYLKLEKIEFGDDGYSWDAAGAAEVTYALHCDDD